MRIVGVISLATGALLDLAIGPYSGKATGEHALLRQLTHIFTAGDVVLGDCYYASFFLIALLKKMNVDVVLPMHSARGCDFRRGKRLGKKDHLVQWHKPAKPKWMNQETYEQIVDTITIRELAVTIDHKGFCAKNKVMVTTFVNANDLNKNEVASLYKCRWFVEITLKAIKETMQMDILRGKTPEMVRKEIWAHLLAYNLIRTIMAQSARQFHKNPSSLSFKCAMQFIAAFCQYGLIDNSQAYAYLLKAIAHKTVGNRSGRSEPRMIKRRPKSFARLQNHRSCYHTKKA